MDFRLYDSDERLLGAFSDRATAYSVAREVIRLSSSQQPVLLLLTFDNTGRLVSEALLSSQRLTDAPPP